MRTLIFLAVLSALAFPTPQCVPELSHLRNVYRQLSELNDTHAQTRVFLKLNPAEEHWPVDGDHSAMPHMRYDVFFKPALGHDSVDEWAEERKVSGKSTHVADFFGSAVFTDHPERYDSLTGIRLRGLDKRMVPKQYPVPQWKEVEADLTLPRSWNGLDADLKKRGIGKFDLIFCRPNGPLRKISRESVASSDAKQSLAGLVVLRQILSRMWQRLARQGGMALVELTPAIAESAEFKLWLASLKDKKIKAEVIYNDKIQSIPIPILRLVRNRNSAAEL